MNMYCSQVKICEQSAYDIFCRGCCQTLVRVPKKALVSSRATLGASQYLVSCIIYKAMKSKLSQLKRSRKMSEFFESVIVPPNLTYRKSCISVVWLLDNMYILYPTSHQCFIIQGQLKVRHFAYRKLCTWRRPSVSVHSFRDVDEKGQLPLFCFPFISTMATTLGHDHSNLRCCRGKEVFQEVSLKRIVEAVVSGNPHEAYTVTLPQS